MFAGKFRSWMEAHLGRPKKNKTHKDKKGSSASKEVAPPERGVGPEGQTAITDLPASSHLHRGPLTAESLDSISTCPTTGSERGGLRPHVNLSSPESAYSTGYSTDGTSPGTSFPPEYYINLRTGTHYFHGLGVPGVPPSCVAPLPHPGPLHLPPGLPPLPAALQPALQPHHTSRQTWAWPTGLVQQPEPPRLSYLTPGRSRKQQHQQQQHQQLLLEQQQQHLHLLQQQQQQHQHMLQQQQHLYQQQQKQQQQQYMLSRTESSTEEDLVGKARRPSSGSSSTTISSHSNACPWQQPSDCVSSPRARTRIRTNPWVPNSPAPTPNATPTPRTRNQQQQQQQKQYPQQVHANGRQALGGCSSSLSLSSSSSYGSASDVSLQRRPGGPGSLGPGGAGTGHASRSRTRGGPGGRGSARPQPLFQLNEESPSVEDKPLVRALSAQPSPRAPQPAVVNGNGTGNGQNGPVGRASRASNRPCSAALRSSSGSSFTSSRARQPQCQPPCAPQRSCSSSSSSASSRTANNGSPPNLSDNEDVEDVTLNEMMGRFDESYVYEKETDILSDSDPTDVEDYGDDGDGGDEQTDEGDLDFIDRSSMSELCDERGQLANRGHCTFHNFPPGRRQSSRRRSSRRETPSRASTSSRDASVGSPRSSRRSSDRQRRRSAPRPQQQQQAQETSVTMALAGGNLNRIVMQRLLLRSAEIGPGTAVGTASGGLGTRSAGNTPLSARRNQALQSRAVAKMAQMAQMAQMAPPPPAPAPHPRLTEYAMAEADREADRKYRQLIMQAEHILVSMTGSPMGSPLPSRTAPHYGTPPMSKRHYLPNLNRRLDYLKQGVAAGPGVGPVGPGGPLHHAHCPSPLARDPRLNDNAEENRNRWSPLVMPRRALEDPDLRRKQCFTPSPSEFRRAPVVAPTPCDAAATPVPPSVAQRNVNVSRACGANNNLPDAASPMSTPGGRRRGPPPVPPPRTVTAPPAAQSPAPVPAPAPAPVAAPAPPRMNKPFQLNLKALPLPAAPSLSSPNGWTAIEASSSDSDGSLTPRPSRVPLALDRRAKSTATTPTSSRPPLVTYKSVDHRLDMLDACPQSEPVKRKVYAGSQTLERLSKKMENTEIMPRTPVQDAEDDEDARRKDMLMQTLQQLKQSLESQSACLQMPA